MSMTPELLPNSSGTPNATLIPNSSGTPNATLIPNSTKLLGFIPNAKGWMVVVATIGGIMLADTKIAPVVLSVLVLADLDQIIGIIDNKTTGATIA